MGPTPRQVAEAARRIPVMPTPKRAPYRSKQRYICQFCGYDGIGWKDRGDLCPKCGRRYDYVFAQDSP